jgi:MFS transporter, ACS family, solute carrier family 17 (sodium-dependent inorganic phosphate cotransporter), other
MQIRDVGRERISAAACRRRLPWPKRVDVALLAFFAMMIALADRVNLSVAAPVLMRERGWDTVQMGWVLSGFFIGYSLMMVPMGILADRYGAKWVLAFSVAWWSLFTALTPWPRSLLAMTVVRIFMGMGESGMMPCVNSILVRWFPRHEYSRAATFSWSGGNAGAILAFPLASAILSYWGWPSVFFVFACFGVLWLPFWITGVTDDPSVSRGLSDSELTHILSGLPSLRRITRVPWKQILSLPAIFALMALHFSFNWIAYVLASWLPTYLLVERHFSLSNMAIGSSLPFLSILIGGNLFGMMIDRSTLRHDRTLVRKLFVIPFMMAGGTLLLVPAASSPVLLVVLLCLAAGLASGAYPVITSGSLDIAPRYSGTVVGLQNCVANFSGILVPVVTGYVVKVSGWTAAFWLAASVCALGFLAYSFFGQAKKLVD